ncbi:hypothetical protein RI543_004745 [Arxiozyma heterogenica]|uniref:Amino acid transporter transmembrane domain-containing protein n=2 Tax=Arxiozyma heterogenica TaxID=278026 RepID=A0AAN7WKG2_9SACH|nr:hypothetical protein RI543_004745 [Kazachstania heterogenica]
MVSSTDMHSGDKVVRRLDEDVDSLLMKSQNIQVPRFKGNKSMNHFISQSLVSRRGSAQKGSMDMGLNGGPLSIGHKSKRMDATLFIDIHSPNFKTSDSVEGKEILNSVKENYLSDHMKKVNINNANGSSSSSSSLQQKDTDTFIGDRNLQRSAGDMTRDIYKLATQSCSSKKYKTLEDIQLTSERNRRKSTASGLNVPGGFRREYIVKKIRNEQASASTNSDLNCKNDVFYGSIPKITRSIDPSFESDCEVVNESGNDLTNVPFFTRNFLEFLYLYGHFAGESFEDDFLPESIGQSIDEETGSVVPITNKTMKEQIHAVRGTASDRKAFLLLLKAFIGTGVLFLPKAFFNGGLLFSTGMLIFFGVYSYWCYYILVKAKEITKVSSFGDIGLKLYGHWLKILILFALGITQIGFAGAYMIFTSKNLAAFVENVFYRNINLAYIMIFQLIIFIPISFVRNVSKLSLPALISNFCIMFGLIIIVIFFLNHWIYDLSFRPMTDIIYGVNTERWSLFIGTAIFAFEGIGLIIQIQESMKQPEHFPKVLRSVITVVTILFVTMGSIGYLIYGSNVETVILLNLPQQNIFVNIIQLLYSLAIMLSTPLQLFPAIKIIEDKFFSNFLKIYSGNNKGQESLNVPYQLYSGKLNWKIKWWKNLMRSIIVSSVATYAYFGINSLDKVVAIVGSFCCLPLVYVVPPMVHLRCYTRGLKKPTHTTARQINMIIWFDCFLILFGVVSMLYTSYQSIVVS